MKYMILMQVRQDVLDALTAEQMQAIGEGHQAFMDSITASGEMLGTVALADPSQSKVVRGAGGAPEVVDGPFAETKEFMGGYYLIEVESEERALELARQIPDAAIDGLALEVRPVMFSAGSDV
ncbi:YciI family protein [Microbacterium sp. Au-Mic1]|uniref:YciI family protein n=1 Tax=Microbacterium sp. Au-Mic1 TaxID=2906457 RepID=UPI001E576830|nr:YciI family protein [Microbacterium sp. Au-Mic1]MCE4025252.1 YciI family protein [Microbacterium sp. Au-Mic1]